MVNPQQLLYFAYASNLHPIRLGARIPSRQLLGVAELSGYQLLFHKRGADLSAKCNARHSGDPAHKLLGALFSISADEKPILDEFEGTGYAVTEVTVQHADVARQAFMYVAKEAYIDDSLLPFQWYKEFVYLGARFLEFPESYVRQLVEIEAVEDVDRERYARNEQMLKLMR